MIIKLYKSLSLKWYQELIMIVAAVLTNGFTIQVVILQNEFLKSVWKYISMIIWTVGLYIILVLVFVSIRELVAKKKVGN
ncbi:hypothetical protein [Niallia circulans]|uniref:hypothetical protein n=1 Tax=Niallia circulans TaxID=1397 RepID=UPI0026F0F17E|nr:hypothetical protein [Niallia circulans]